MQTLHLVSVFAFSTTPNRQSICNKKALARKRQPTKEADRDFSLLSTPQEDREKRGLLSLIRRAIC